jgi:phosphomannomutase
VVEFIRELGGEPVMCRVGHSHAKKLLREIDGLFGGELAGHYYFRDNAWCDSAMIAALLVLSILSREKVPFSRLIERVRRYHHSGEINFRVEDKDGAIRRILADYPDGTLSTLDGIRIDYPTWWFNLRKSNTEPYLRLVVEATGARELDERVRELKGKIEPKEGKRADA